jgi:uncharacterized membrane protein YccC
MALRITHLQHFFFSHYFLGGVRQAVGMLLPVILVGGIFGHFSAGLVATFGAQCLALIDQPGGPARHRSNEMLGGAVLGVMTVSLTGFASTYPVVLWLVVVAQCFFYSMFSVYGRRGGMIGFAALLLMTLTMHEPLAPTQVLEHAAYTLGGALFYWTFSTLFSRALWLTEERQALSLALHATAHYVSARAQLCDDTTELDDCYRLLIARQSVMTEQHQGARDMVLRALPRGKGYGDRHRVMIWNVFLDMLTLMDTLVATHPDYVTLRRAMGGKDILLFMRDALVKIALDLDRIALAVAYGRPAARRGTTKAELRAIEFEIEQLKQQGLGQREPEVLALVVQALRRLRTAARIVDHLIDHSNASPHALPNSSVQLGKSVTRFLSRQQYRPGLLASNVRLDSPHFRYALRVALASALAMALTGLWLTQVFSAHNYWVMLTIVIIMKPGFALTRQRNVWRLGGTLIGCALALLLFGLTDSAEVLFLVLIGACIMANSLAQINYMLSATLNTLFVVLVFHFVSPGSVSWAVIGERAMDTAIGCTLALLCSYVLPWWEYRYMRPLARAAIRANRQYLMTGLQYAEVMRHTAETTADAVATREEADVAWRLARRNVHIAFSNLAEAFYRMMREPKSHQINVPEMNNLMLQNHVLASQITATVPLLAALPVTPPNVQRTLDSVSAMLDLDCAQWPAMPAASAIENTGDLAILAYPVKQLARAAHMVRSEMTGLAEATVPTPPPASTQP